MPTELFIGLVGHERSRSTDESTEKGLMPGVADAAPRAGATVTAAVSDRDEYSEELLTVSADVVRVSIQAELEVELRWLEYLSGRPAGADLKAFMALRRGYREAKAAPPWRRTLGRDDAGPRMVRRLANIEMSHVCLIEEAAASEGA